MYCFNESEHIGENRNRQMLPLRAVQKSSLCAKGMDQIHEHQCVVEE